MMRGDWKHYNDVPIDHFKETRKTYTDKHGEPAHDVDAEARIDGDLFVGYGVTVWPKRDVQLDKEGKCWYLDIHVANASYRVVDGVDFYTAVRAAKVWAFARELARRQTRAALVKQASQSADEEADH